MRLPTSARHSGVTFNMTPMIDVVFLLIIFFLVSSHLARQEVQMELDLPSAASGNREVEQNRPRVTINVTPEGAIMLGSRAVTSSELTERLKFELQRLGENLEVRIRTDRGVLYERIEPILLASSRAGAWNVTFAVTPRGN